MLHIRGQVDQWKDAGGRECLHMCGLQGEKLKQTEIRDWNTMIEDAIQQTFIGCLQGSNKDK
jgi:hypothetical protein